ncbi:tyrosine-type recombinase/integrase [Gilliamella sp. B2865]|uniref:tyrosine-type recombinase/integrase n=1 Tax=Gilliamella sp. B2865 TaxID=2817984 RepID=UPI002269E367|nr:tyrosine-type recombinase/integrase [Gilliamella sp. B2865]MCX8678632.1 tyrosine-type recombinase/integrase [Gilliamella sp. B2865]
MSIMMREWLISYEKSLDNKQFSARTIIGKIQHLKIISRKIGDLKLKDVQPLHLKNIIDIYINADKPSPAKAMHSLLSDVFNEAIIAGLINNNPIWPLKYPTQRVKRARLMFNEFMQMYNYAKENLQNYLSSALMLALVTAQRPGDLLELGYDKKDFFVQNDHLFIHQMKGRKYVTTIYGEKKLIRHGAKIALPLNLTLNEVNMSIEDAILNCGGNENFIELNGQPVQYWRLNQDFCRLRDTIFPAKYWEDYNPPSFFEIRSLAERLYRKQGVNTQVLLGHKYRSTTDLYNDLRGREWHHLII